MGTKQGLIIGTLLLFGCGAHDESGEPEALGIEQSAASNAIFQDTKVLNNQTTGCQVVQGSVLRVGGWTATTPSAVVVCPLPDILPGQLWDTVRLRKIVYNHSASVTSTVMCTIQWMNRSNGTLVIQTPPLESYLNSPSHQESGAGYYSTGNGWIGGGTPTSYNTRAYCRIPFGAYLYNFTYSYEDTF
jgi:hypothetical protein